MESCDFSRYELNLPSEILQNDPHAWKKSISTARAQSEYQKNRLQNLELLKGYGKSSWLRRIGDLERVEKGLKMRVKKLKGEREMKIFCVIIIFYVMFVCVRGGEFGESQEEGCSRGGWCENSKNGK